MRSLRMQGKLITFLRHDFCRRAAGSKRSLLESPFTLRPAGLSLFSLTPEAIKEAERRKAQGSQLRNRRCGIASSGTRSPSGVPPRLSPVG
jgi:hypothetical protein